MGLSPCFRYEKYRSTYRLPGLPGLLVELDETPIGDFLELEGDSASIDRAAALLGFGPGDYITKSYGILFLEQRRSAGGAAERLPLGAGALVTCCFHRQRSGLGPLRRSKPKSRFLTAVPRH